MIKVGDIVRFSNRYLRSLGKTTYNRHYWHRGKQVLMTVTDIIGSGRWNWRTKQFEKPIAKVAIRENGCLRYFTHMNLHYLRFVRRPDFRKSKEYKKYIKEMFG